MPAYAIRLIGFTLAVALVSYLAICFRYAETLTRVDRHRAALARTGRIIG